MAKSLKPKRLASVGIAIALFATLIVLSQPWRVLGQDGVQTVINQGTTPRRFEVALIGDLLYNPKEEAEFPALIADINRSNAAFVIHDGDIKSGAAPCSSELLSSRKTTFQTFRIPFVLVPGDNEWTDCHRTGDDPLEQLTQLRKIFFGTDYSLGQTVLKLERQGSVSPVSPSKASPSKSNAKFALYRENVRWVYGSVLFVGLHVVGSNNNLGRTPAMDQEFQARNQANLAWIKDAFAIAKAQNLSGLMVVIHANPGFELPPDQRTGFNAFLEDLRSEVLGFDKPVMLVHGDSHTFGIDKPLFDNQNQRIMRFTRLETFGTPDVHWVKAVIDPSDSSLFRLEPIQVKSSA